MKLKINKLIVGSLVAAWAFSASSCNEFLDRQPIVNVTPEAYFSNEDQVAAYLNNYYAGHLVDERGQQLSMSSGWWPNRPASDQNTDNYYAGASESYFVPNRWQVPANKNLQGYFGNVRIWNYFINTIEEKKEAGLIQGSTANIEHYLGEGYFFRALTYFNMMCRFGDLPIITEVLVNDNEPLKEASVRKPRNEVARFILSDLDKAISMLQPVGFMNNVRINKQVAQLYKSRVALFEGTFEKYHRGSGRVPGDANWPGDKSYSVNIDNEIQFFLTEAMNAAKAVADQTTLTENSHKMNPEYGQIYGWNPYFEMFSQPTLESVPEVLMWRQYNKSISISHNAPARKKSGNNDGLLRSLINCYVMANGLPIYAPGSGYKGDKSLGDEVEGRDERLQLFLWTDKSVFASDPSQKSVADAQAVSYFTIPNMTVPESQTRDVTGYRGRKYATYDYSQTLSDDLLGQNACPIFRAAEALLNYMEACYEKNGSLDGSAQGYWKALRRRAGVNEDYNVTIAATDMAQESANQDLGAYSGLALVDPTLFNIRRERRSELIDEGFRWNDLMRWRSFDRLISTQKFMPEGINLWEDAYKKHKEWYLANVGKEEDWNKLFDGTSNAILSNPSCGKYQRPTQASQNANNMFINGYGWMEAYYLYPISIEDLTLVNPAGTFETSTWYQNPNWPANEAGYALK